MIINVNDVITLTDNRQFLVLSDAIYNQTRYFYLIELTDGGEQIVDNIKIVKELKDGDGSKLIAVVDYEEIDNVKEILVANLETNELE